VSEEEELLRVRPGREQVDEWRAVQALVDQRVFAWTRLLSRLEELLPASVRLQTIAPSVAEGVATLELRALAESLDDGYGFWEALLHAPEFEDVLAPSIEDRPEGALFSYSMRYRPGAIVSEPASDPAQEPGAEVDDEPVEPASETSEPAAEAASRRQVAVAR
jgi:Tfp pilus assembly protein PilN